MPCISAGGWRASGLWNNFSFTQLCSVTHKPSRQENCRHRKVFQFPPTIEELIPKRNEVLENTMPSWRHLCIISIFLNCESYQQAVVAEWLRRLTRNQMGIARAGSNPADCEYFSSVEATLISAFYFSNLIQERLKKYLRRSCLIQWQSSLRRNLGKVPLNKGWVTGPKFAGCAQLYEASFLLKLEPHYTSFGVFHTFRSSQNVHAQEKWHLILFKVV